MITRLLTNAFIEASGCPVCRPIMRVFFEGPTGLGTSAGSSARVWRGTLHHVGEWPERHRRGYSLKRFAAGAVLWFDDLRRKPDLFLQSLNSAGEYQVPPALGLHFDSPKTSLTLAIDGALPLLVALTR